MPAAALTRHLGPERAAPASLAIGTLFCCALIALADPSDGGLYPACPTRVLLGIDCPACGTLRGLHSLSRGRIGEALDHNLLLFLAVPIGALIWWHWLRAALGRSPRPVVMPPWTAPALIALAAVFAVARNLPIPGLSWLDSAA